MYEQSVLALNNIDGIVTEEEKLSLIDEFYKFDFIKNSKYFNDFKKSYKYVKNIVDYEFKKDEVVKIFRNIVNFTVIPKNVFEDNKNIIEEQIHILNSKKSSKIKKIKAKEIIYSFTLSIMHYQYFNSDGTYLKLDYETIKIIECNYTALGFEPIYKKKVYGNTEGMFF